MSEIPGIIANPCPICGGPIPERRRRHGHPPKTCSEACRRERKRRMERERYNEVKGTGEWKAARRTYLRKLRRRLEDDPEFAAIFRAESAARTRAWNERIRSSDPEKHAAMKAQKRAERAEWYDNLLRDPAALEAHRAKYRAWYRSLSAEERDRIYYQPRRRRLKGDNK